MRKRITDIRKQAKPYLCVLIGILCVFSTGVHAQKKQGQPFIDSLLGELSGQKEDTNKVNILILLARSYSVIDLKKGVDYAKAGIDLSERLKFMPGIIDGNIALGINYGSEGDYTQALAHLNTALKMSGSINDKQRAASCNSNLGNVLYYLGNYPAALSNYYSALKIYEAAGIKAKVANCHNNIGMICERREDNAEALTHFTAALNTYKEIGNERTMATTLQNIAGVYYNQNNFSSAVDNYHSAMKLYRESGDKNGEGDCYIGLGNIYNEKGDNAAALKSYLVSLSIFEETGDKYSIGKSVGHIGNMLSRQRKYADAEVYALKSLAIGMEINSLELISYGNELLSEISAGMGNYKKSLEYFKKFIVAKDSIFNNKNTQKALFVQLQYDFDKKEELAKVEQSRKEATVVLQLQRKNFVIYGTVAAFVLLLIIGLLLLRQSRLRQNQQKTELEQKQLRAQMNPHFIFNCLNSIQHFVVANDVKNANKYLSGFALLMRQTLENSKDGIITLRKEIAYLENYLSLELLRFEDKFSAKISCADDINADTIEIPSMIIQPFIENAIRHGLCYLEDKEGILKIRFYRRDNYLFCEVDDNGIGRERSRKLKQNQQIAYESQGMELTRQRLELVSKSYGSDYSIELIDKVDTNNKPAGTTVIIKFPLEK